MTSSHCFLGEGLFYGPAGTALLELRQRGAFAIVVIPLLQIFNKGPQIDSVARLSRNALQEEVRRIIEIAGGGCRGRFFAGNLKDFLQPSSFRVWKRLAGHLLSFLWAFLGCYRGLF